MTNEWNYLSSHKARHRSELYYMPRIRNVYLQISMTNGWQ